MMDKKYELTAESVEFNGKQLYRIRALKDFGGIKAGDLGGYIESENNLDQSGEAWVGGHALVSDEARVSGNAQVIGNAQVSGEAWVSGRALVSGNAQVSGNARVERTTHVFVAGPLGRNDRYVTFFRTNKGILVDTGCYIDFFRKKVRATHGSTRHAQNYLAVADVAERQINGEGGGIA
jgi:hypothetical protein